MEFYDTLVTIELRTVPEGTELTLTHAFFPTVEERDNHQSGWAGCLSRLLKVLCGIPDSNDTSLHGLPDRNS